MDQKYSNKSSSVQKNEVRWNKKKIKTYRRFDGQNNEAKKDWIYPFMSIVVVVYSWHRKNIDKKHRLQKS